MTSDAFDDYDMIDALNWSRLKHMAKSPAHYVHNIKAGCEDTAALKLGRAVHMAVLEPDRFGANVVRWEGAVRRGKAWDEFQAAHRHQDILTEREHDQCLSIAAAVRKDSTASAYLAGGKSEVTLRWTHRQTVGIPYEVACKGRCDLITPRAIVDLKTCADASPEAFGRDAFKMLYYAQAAMYSDGFEAAHGSGLPFVIVAVEKSSPWVVQCYELPEDVLQMGRELYRGLIDRLVACRAESVWPGYATGVLPLELPRWAVQDDDAETDGLTFSTNKESSDADEF